MKGIVTFFKSIGVAFATYSRIPMPNFKWGSQDMKYQLIFFPWVGGVIGALIYLWNILCQGIAIDNLPRLLITIVIPLLITGGLHIDGYMDTCDALHSYKSREEKLNIMKDPHIGAFSVICLLTYTLILLGGMSLVYSDEGLRILCIIPFIVRAGSAIAIKCLKPAKADGMLKTTADAGDSGLVIPLLFMELIAAFGLIIYLDLIYGSLTLIIQLLVFLYYKKMSYKEFGGVTGDLAGYYVCIAELIAVLSIGILDTVSFY